jgi:hypothetical protein
MSGHGWDHMEDGEQLGRILELLAVADMPDRDWRGVRGALLAAWPTRQDVSNWAQPLGDPKVAPVEADVDVPEV